MLNFEFSNIIEIVETFKTELDCYKYLESLRWGNNIVCPFCGSAEETTHFWRLKDNKTLKCSHCKMRFTAKTGTIFEETRLSLRKWFMAIFLLSSHSKGISSVQLSKDLKITQKTAWFLAHRIRHVTENFAENKEKFDKPLETDETYCGGKNKNKHQNKKVKGTQGRNTQDKTCILGFLQRKTETSSAKVLAYKIPNASGKILNNEVLNHVKEGNEIFTDEWKGYKKLHFKFKHEFICHSKKEWTRGKVHTNSIENYWSIFKRIYIGIYHHMSEKHLNRYLNTLAFRYNNMDLNSNEKFKKLLSKCQGNLSYKGLIKKQ